MHDELAPTGDPHLKRKWRYIMAQGKDGTLVELEHQHLERYAARREQMPAIVDSEDRWSGLRASVARLASA